MDEIKNAIDILKKGGIVIFPTDTAFGIGCRIDNEKSIERLFKIRNRPADMATPVLIDSIEMSEDYAFVSKEIQDKLISKYWPGALTIVLPSKVEKVPVLVRGGGDTVGLRIPNHTAILSIIKGVGVPILGPSANFHGEKTPFSIEDLDPELIEQVDFVVQGQTSKENVSTVIDCSKKPWRILRMGAVKLNI